jgi:hypothetical protein
METTTTTNLVLQDVKKSIDLFFKDFDEEKKKKKIETLVYMDEVAVFFDIEASSTLEIKGTLRWCIRLILIKSKTACNFMRDMYLRW